MAGPKRTGDDGEGHDGRDGDRHDGPAIGDVGLVPFEAGDGQVAVDGGQQETRQQQGVVDRVN